MHCMALQVFHNITFGAKIKEGKGYDDLKWVSWRCYIQREQHVSIPQQSDPHILQWHRPANLTAFYLAKFILESSDQCKVLSIEKSWFYLLQGAFLLHEFLMHRCQRLLKKVSIRCVKLLGNLLSSLRLSSLSWLCLCCTIISNLVNSTLSSSKPSHFSKQVSTLFPQTINLFLIFILLKTSLWFLKKILDIISTLLSLLLSSLSVKT